MDPEDDDKDDEEPIKSYKDRNIEELLRYIKLSPYTYPEYIT